MGFSAHRPDLNIDSIMEKDVAERAIAPVGYEVTPMVL